MTTYFKFPAGEVHCKIDSNPYKAMPEMIYRPFLRTDNLNDYLISCLFEADVKHYQTGWSPALFLPYLPYSRQDRRTSGHEPFAIKVIGNLLNTAPLKNVITLDIHSDVAYACINNLVCISPLQIWKSTLRDIGVKDKTLVIPDAGAFKKLESFSPMFGNTVVALKHRNTDTGRLEVKHVVGEVEGKHCIIVDDICDGGMTFILLANELYARGAKRVDLMVTHGIFSKGFAPLWSAGIGKIYTTDSFEQTEATADVQIISCRSIAMKMESGDAL